MPIFNAKKRGQTKRKFFDFTTQIRGVNNSFSRKRKKYLTAVVKGDEKLIFSLESELFSALKEKAPAKVIVYMADDLFVSDLRGYLRQGIPLSNALKISLLISDLRARKDIHLPDNPRYRKPEVLRQELEIIELEYQSLRLARKKAEEFGLREIEARLRQKISSKAKSINEYYTIFKKRLKT